MKKPLVLVLTLALLLSLVTFPNMTAAEDADLIPMRYYMPGGPTPEAAAVNAAINEKLHADGVMIDFTPIYVPWGEWIDKINVLLSSGEEFELLHIMEDWVTTSMYTGRGQLTEVTPLIDEYAPELWDKFDEIMWRCVTVNGKIMSIPAYWRDNSGDMEGMLNFNETQLTKYGLPVPKTIDEIFEVLPVLQEKWKEEDGVSRYIYEHSANRCPVSLHRAYDSWPFYASQDGIFQVFQTGEAALYFESEEFKNDCAFMHKAYTMGLIHPDTLNQPQDEINLDKQNGDYLLGIMTAGDDIYDDDGVTVKYHFAHVWLNEDGPFLLNLPLLNSNAIPITTPNPQAGIQFLNWMYSSKENQDLVLYGIKDVHWTEPDADTYDRIKDEYNVPLYAFDFWMIEYVPYHRFDVMSTWDEYERADHMGNVRPDQTVVSVMTGFNFNTEPVKVEYANMMAEYTTSILPIKKGVVAYEDGIDEALAKMRAAGSQAVIDEYQKQLTAYIAQVEAK